MWLGLLRALGEFQDAQSRLIVYVSDSDGYFVVWGRVEGESLQEAKIALVGRLSNLNYREDLSAWAGRQFQFARGDDAYTFTVEEDVVTGIIELKWTMR